MLLGNVKHCGGECECGAYVETYSVCDAIEEIGHRGDGQDSDGFIPTSSFMSALVSFPIRALRPFILNPRDMYVDEVPPHLRDPAGAGVR